MSGVWIPILALMIPIVAIFAGAIFKPWLALQERKMELEAQMVAEKAAQSFADIAAIETARQAAQADISQAGADQIEGRRLLTDLRQLAVDLNRVTAQGYLCHENDPFLCG